MEDYCFRTFGGILWLQMWLCIGDYQPSLVDLVNSYTRGVLERERDATQEASGPGLSERNQAIADGVASTSRPLPSRRGTYLVLRRQAAPCRLAGGGVVNFSSRNSETEI